MRAYLIMPEMKKWSIVKAEGYEELKQSELVQALMEQGVAFGVYPMNVYGANCADDLADVYYPEPSMTSCEEAEELGDKLLEGRLFGSCITGGQAGLLYALFHSYDPDGEDDEDPNEGCRKNGGTGLKNEALKNSKV